MEHSSKQLRYISANPNLVSFLKLSHKIVEFGKMADVNITPFRSEVLPHFSILPIDRQEQIISHLEIIVNICQTTIDQGRSLKDSATLTWNAIKHFKFRPSSDLFQFITNDQVIEIHDTAGIQIFRNFNFYNFCSYSVEELYCYSFDCLYSRDEAVLHKIWNVAKMIYTEGVRNTILMPQENHIITEVYSPFKYQIDTALTHISPLVASDGVPVGAVSLETCNLLGPLLVASDEEALLKSYKSQGEASLMSTKSKT